MWSRNVAHNPRTAFNPAATLRSSRSRSDLHPMCQMSNRSSAIRARLPITGTLVQALCSSSYKAQRCMRYMKLNPLRCGPLVDMTNASQKYHSRANHMSGKTIGARQQCSRNVRSFTIHRKICWPVISFVHNTACGKKMGKNFLYSTRTPFFWPTLTCLPGRCLIAYLKMGKPSPRSV